MKNIELTKLKRDEIHIKGKDLMLGWKGKEIRVWSRADYPKRK